MTLSLLAWALAFGLAGCYPPPESLDFASDPRILDGSFIGTIDVSRDGSGALLNIELEATAQYMNSNAYAVSGTVRLEGTEEAGGGYDFVGAFSGVVNGGGAQRYVAPQVSPPVRASLLLEADGAPWLFRAYQRSPYYPTDLGETGWRGSATLAGDEPYGGSYPLRLWRAP